MTNQNNPTKTADIRSEVRKHYGEIAEKVGQPQAADCCGSVEQKASSSSCCSSQDTIDLEKITTLYQADDVHELPQDVTELSLGCGDPVTLASLQPGQTVLDLGSGGGIDCFLAARRVGKTGHVIGVDMTPQMLERARANKAKIGAENVEFRLGEIEHLPVADNSVDVVISNCVINLSPDKLQVFREAFRVLRPGGRLSVSDIVTDGPLPEKIKNDLSAWAGCISGALDAKDYLATIQEAGFVDIQLSPVYWEQSLVEDGLKQLNLTPETRQNRQVLVYNEGNQFEVIDLGESGSAGAAQWAKAVFSAKVTARKP